MSQEPRTSRLKIINLRIDISIRLECLTQLLLLKRRFFAIIIIIKFIKLHIKRLLKLFLFLKQGLFVLNLIDLIVFWQKNPAHRLFSLLDSVDWLGDVEISVFTYPANVELVWSDSWHWKTKRKIRVLNRLRDLPSLHMPFILPQIQIPMLNLMWGNLLLSDFKCFS